MPTLGDFISNEDRGTKGLQKAGVDNPALRQYISSVFFPYKPNSSGTVAVGDDISPFTVQFLGDFYESIRFKSGTDATAEFSYETENSPLSLFWNSESELSDHYIPDGNNQALNAKLRQIFTAYSADTESQFGTFQDGKDPIPDNSVLSSALIEKLNSNNRFNPGENSPFFDIDAAQLTTTGNHFVYNSSSVIRGPLPPSGSNKFGVYDLNLAPVTVKEIRRSVLTNLIGATGHDNILDDDTVDMGNFNLKVQEIRANPIAYGQFPFPGMGKISMSSMGIQRSSLINDQGGSENASEEDSSINSKSFGQMNSPAEPFHSPFAVGMIMPALLSLITLFALFFLLSFFFGGLEKAAKAESALKGDGGEKDPTKGEAEHILDPKEDIQDYPFGSNTNLSEPEDFLPILIRFIKSSLDWPFYHKYNFFRNAFRGLIVFMGMSARFDENSKKVSTKPGDLLPALMGIIKTPGYYTVITKQVMREFDNIVKGFEEFGNLNLFDFASFVRVLLGLFESIRESATWRFILTTSNIGEQIGKSILDKQNPSWAGPYADSFRGKNINPPSNNNARRAMSRISGKHMGKSHLSPISISDFSSLLVSGQQHDSSLQGLKEYTEGSIQASGTPAYKVAVNNKYKISREVVEEYEKALNSEYCPFYIQDLRNNEIINMPAFITALNDNFQPEYSTTNGYGRTDSVKVYTRTSRQIQISFKLIAMSKEDHEHMWFVVNRLVTMLYPQRSIGRPVKTKEGGKFIQPFSSVPTTSPLVRLRLGDLYRSNFSESSFAKMLGYPGRVVPPGSELTEEDQAKLNSLSTSLKLKLQQIQSKIYGEFDGILNVSMPAEKKKEKLSKFVTRYTDKDAGDANAIKILAGADYAIGSFKESSGLLGNVAALLPGSEPSEKGGSIFSGKTARMGLGRLKKIFIPAKKKLEGNKYEVPAGAKVYAAIEIVHFSKGPIKDFLDDLIKAKKSDSENPQQAMSKIFDEAQKKSKKSENKKEFGLFKKMEEIGLTKQSMMAAANIKSNDPDSSIVLYVSVNKMRPFVHYKVLLGEINDEPDVQRLLKSAKEADDKKKGVIDFIRKNVFYKSFINNAGYGLAGVITQFSLDYGDSTWEISENSKAPKKIDVTMSFDPIHDLSPGLSSEGTMMNPVFPVGNASGGHKSPWVKEKDPELALKDSSLEMIRAKLDGLAKEAAPPSFPPGF